ncbi:MAG TPA: PEP-CTERM sorting domain-containing protein [Rhodocyclaceae bacterium]|nr:PEP-CTERM sorting domain-containing protein [Rhodocyclaceae bacterium]
MILEDGCDRHSFKNNLCGGVKMFQMKKMVAAVTIVAASIAGAQAATVLNFEDAASLGAVGNANNSGLLDAVTGYDGFIFTSSLTSNLQLWDSVKLTANSSAGNTADPVSNYLAPLGTTPTASQTSGNWMAGFKTSANNFSFAEQSGAAFALDSLFLYIGKTTTSSTVPELVITGFLNGVAVSGASFSEFKPALGGQTVTLAQLGSAFGNVDKINISSKDGVLGFDNITIAPVPEPSTYAMLLAGLGMIGVIARRRSV